MFLLTTRGRVCVFPSICLYAVQSTICPARMLLCLAADQNCNQCVHTKNRVPLFSGHLARTVTGRQAGSRRDLYSEASVYLCHNDTLTTSMLYLLLSHISTYSITYLFSSHIPPLSIHHHPFWPWGVCFTLYMPRQLHNSLLHTLVRGHWLEDLYVGWWVGLYNCYHKGQFQWSITDCEEMTVRWRELCVLIN